MADKDNDDEYQMDDLDTMDSEPLGETNARSEDLPRTQSTTNVRRNALIVVGLIALLFLGYKFFGSFFSSPKTKAIQEIPSLPQTTEAPPPQPTIPQEPQLPVQTAPQVTTQPSVDNTEINQKLSAVEATQQDVQLQVNAVNSKLSGINNNVSELSEKIASMNQVITSLATKLDQQCSEIAMLVERSKPKPRPVIVIKAPPRLTYYIQAIIPGRAWLIASNGSTITVREGTRIAGYGVVKLIDPIQGRVLISSGRVIRFSQQDS
ncbi:MAG: type IV secretion protein IcmG [Tatlockia sp.]|nr:type IV secretion protein IcmG [Tatlockia sp.]